MEYNFRTSVTGGTHKIQGFPGTLQGRSEFVVSPLGHSPEPRGEKVGVSKAVTKVSKYTVTEDVHTRVDVRGHTRSSRLVTKL